MGPVRLLTIEILCLACSGCLFWMPTQRFVPGNYQSRRIIDDKALAFIELGTTSRPAVLLKLGEPDSVSEDERYLLYRWMTIQGWGFAAVGGAAYSAPVMGLADGGYTGEQTEYLLIEFDEEGVLSWYGEVRSWPERSPRGTLELRVPLTIPISFWDEVEYKVARITLGESTFEFEDRTSSQRNFSIDPGKIVGFELPPWYSRQRYETPVGEIKGNWEGHRQTLAAQMRAIHVPDRDVVYALRFSEETPLGDSLAIAVDVFRVPAVVEYLRRYCPNAVYEPRN